MPITISGSTGIAGVDGSASTPAVQGTDTNTGIFFPAADTIAFGEGGSEAMRIDSSGNVGIGTSSPLRVLHVVSNAAETQLLLRESDSSGPQLLMGADSAVSGSIINASSVSGSNSNLLLQTGGTERARIDSSGRLGIGTSSPDTNFIATVSSGSGAIKVLTSGTSDGIDMTCNTAGTAGQSVYVLPVRTAGSLRGGIQWNGTNLLYNTSSDYRLKTAVAPMQGALERISSLKPCTYIWIEQQLYGEGFIAHELAENIPGAVTGEKDAINKDGSINSQSVDYSKIVVHLVAAIQELSAKVAVLEGKQ